MKKRICIAFTAAVTSSLLLSPSVFANNQEGSVTPILQEENEVDQQRFIKVSGKITEITEQTSGTYFAKIDDEKEPFGFYFDAETKVFDNTGKKAEIEEGMEVTVYIDSNKPMIMIYPPQYSPEVVIVQTENDGTVKLDQFDQDFLNKKKDLIIHIGEGTSITNLSGAVLKPEDIVDKDVLIFYEVILESYPAQIGPSKIVVMEYDQSEELTDIEKAYEIAENDNYEINGIKMIRLRLVAEQLGFEVNSTGKGAILSKGAVTFTITRGTKMYGYNKAIRYFEEAPALLEPAKTYVPYSLLEELIEIE